MLTEESLETLLCSLSIMDPEPDGVFCSFRVEDPDLDGPLDIESNEELLIERKALDKVRDFLLSTGSGDSPLEWAFWNGDSDPVVLAVEDLHFHFSELMADFIMAAGLGSSNGS